MSRRDAARLGDVIKAIEAIDEHLTKGDLNEGLIYDVVWLRLIEIGEAVKGISPDLPRRRARHPGKRPPFDLPKRCGGQA